MRQGNGSDLLGLKDPRSTKIGIIYVASNDDRKSVLAAILTQEKLGREQIAIVLPENQPSKAFQHLQDFDDLRTIRRKLRAQLIFIAPAGPGPAEFARQRRFSVYSSLESYTEALRAESLFAETSNKQKKDRSFGFGRKAAALGGVAAAMALSGKKGQSVSMASLPSNKRTENTPDQTTSSCIDLSNPNQDQQAPLPREDKELVLSESDQVPSMPVVDENDAINQFNAKERPTVASDATADAVNTNSLVGKSIQQPITPDIFAVASIGDDWDALPPASSTSSPQKDISVTGSALNAKPSLPPSSIPKTPDPAGGAEPGIIELSPLPRTVSSRSTVKLPAVGENTATSTVPSSEPPLSHTLSKSSNTGKAEVTTGALAAALPSRAVGVSRSPMRSGKATQTEVRRKKRGLGGLIVVLLIVALLLLCSGVANSVVGLQLFHFVGNSAPATIAITPDSKLEQDSYVIQAVTGDANLAKRQVMLRQLSFSPKEQSKVVTATGVGHVPAQAATGKLTFYNGSNQDFVVGSTTAIPGPNGISVETDGPADIPAAHLPTVGSITVNAHVTTAGASGNMAAGAINETCCASGGFITVVSSAFTGGQDEKDYTFLQQSDVDGYVNQIKSTLSQQALSGVKGQLKPNEQLAGDPECTTQSREDQPVGDQGRNVTSANVTVDATCTGLAYDARGAQTLAQDLLQRKASSDLGQAYTLAGTMVTKSTVTDVNDGVVTLQVTVSGTWYYQFNDKQKQMLANQLANKTRVAAQDFLNSFKGIRKAKMTITNDGDSLPNDPGQIRIIVAASN